MYLNAIYTHTHAHEQASTHTRSIELNCLYSRLSNSVCANKHDSRLCKWMYMYLNVALTYTIVMCSDAIY